MAPPRPGRPPAAAPRRRHTSIGRRRRRLPRRRSRQASRGRNSKFAKAITACDKKLGIKAGAGFGAGRFRGGGAGGSGFTPHFSTATLKSYVACIRKNGYAAMPEPKASKTGSFFPKSVESNAQFKAANKKCESVLLKAFRSFRPGATGAGGGGGAGGTLDRDSGSSTVSSA